MKCRHQMLRGFRLQNAVRVSQFAILAFGLLSGLNMSRAHAGQARRSPASVESAAPVASESSKPSTETEAVLRARLNLKSSDLDARLKLAALLEKKHDWAGVIELLQGQESKLARPNLMLLAKAYEMKNDNLNNNRVLDLCLAMDAKDYACKVGQAQVLARMKRNEDSINAYIEAKDMNPKYAPAYLGLLKQLEADEDNYEARSLLADMRKIFGDKPSYHSDNCRLFSKDAFLEKTIEVCNEAIAADPRNALNYVYLSTTLNEKEEPDKAVALLKKGLTKFPKSDVLLAALAGLEMQQKKYTNAYRDYKSSLAANPKVMDTWTGFGSAALELQKYDESLKSFDHACSLDHHAVKAFRTAATKLRLLKESNWQSKFEDHINLCSPQY